MTNNVLWHWVLRTCWTMYFVFWVCRALSDDVLSLLHVKISYKQRVFKRHFGKRISARGYFNAQMDSCGGADWSGGGLTARINIYKRGKQENRLLSQLVISWFDWLLAYCIAHTEVINPSLHSSKPLWLWLVCHASDAVTRNCMPLSFWFHYSFLNSSLNTLVFSNVCECTHTHICEWASERVRGCLSECY